jgi:glutamate 5-kinase
LEHAAEALRGDEVGTFFAAASEGSRNSRRLWLAHASEVRGKIHLDEGATVAIIERGSSLLPAGVTHVEGTFLRGDAVELVDAKGEVIARGLVGYDADEVPQLIGKSTKELSQTLGEEYGHELIHRDEMVLL